MDYHHWSIFVNRKYHKMNNDGHNIEKTSFDAFINAVGSEIQQAQVRLITAANAQMLFHYWKMGDKI